MTRRRKLIVLAFMLLFVPVCALLLSRSPPEPIYNGKPLSHWLVSGATYVSDDGGGLVYTAHPLDTNALPFLVTALNKTDSSFHQLYDAFWCRCPAWLQKRMSNPSNAYSIQINAISMLQQLGDDARPVIPDLVRMLEPHRDVQLRSQVIRLLGSIGKGDPAARQALINSAQNDPDITPRLAARESLQRIDPVAAARLPPNNPSTLK